ncbi:MULTISPECIES: LuxR family transcriptional regulator [unclassified Frankia]|uniref:helix-turn-helix transcriptional regulator n=1 Tax=unclassified Frankia TaxID=2632575 RepID=UPI001EF5B064|nr:MULTISPECIES: LuxR family transcriptional regulator [unclassified Frankia]
MLGAKDYQAALDLIHTINADDDGPTSPAVLAGMQRLIGSSSAAVTIIDHRRRRLVGAAVQRPEDNLSLVPSFERDFIHHPAFGAHDAGRIRQGMVLSLSDLMDARSLYQNPLYATCYRPIGIMDQLLAFIGVDVSRGVVAIFNRSRRGVSARDREMIKIIIPHVGQAMERHRERQALLAAAHTAGQRAEPLPRAARQLRGLTPREREVAESLAEGASDRQIARALEIAERTVNKHLENIYRKLGVNSRTALLLLLQRGPC